MSSTMSQNMSKLDDKQTVPKQVETIPELNMEESKEEIKESVPTLVK